MTPEEAEAYQQRAIRGLENLGLEDEAGDVADMTPTEYAEKKGIEITESNPRRRLNIMPTKEQLQQQIDELTEENEELQSRLDEILDIVAPPEDDDDQDDDSGE